VCKAKTCLYLRCLTSLIFAFHSQWCAVHWWIRMHLHLPPEI
jgi:hypothetical protein